MRLNEIDFSGQKPVDGYGEGGFRVDGTARMGPLALTPEGVRIWGGWEDTAFSGIDVLLVGTGAEITAVPAGFRAALESRGIGVEQMATPAACRSYNVLLSEGRRVGLAALPV